MIIFTAFVSYENRVSNMLWLSLVIILCYDLYPSKINLVKIGTLSKFLWVPPLSTRVGTHIRKSKIFYCFIVCSKPLWTCYFFSWDTYVKAQGPSPPCWDNVPTFNEFLFWRLPLPNWIHQTYAIFYNGWCPVHFLDTHYRVRV